MTSTIAVPQLEDTSAASLFVGMLDGAMGWSKKNDNKEQVLHFVSLSKTNKVADLLEEGVFGIGDKILALPESDMENLFFQVFALLSQIDSKTCQTIIPRLTTLLMKSKRPGLSLKLMVKLLNQMDALSSLLGSQLNGVRIPLLLSTMQYALTSDQAKSLSSASQVIQQWCVDWKMNADDLSDSLLLLSHLSKAANDYGESKRFLYEYLVAVEKASKAKFEASKPHANLAVLWSITGTILTCSSSSTCASVSSSSSSSQSSSSIRSSSVLPVLTSATSSSCTSFCPSSVTALAPQYLDCLTALPAVQQLEKDSKYAPTFRLLSIFVSGDVESYAKFSKENSSFISSLGLNDEDAFRRIRILSFCSMAATKDKLTFDELIKKLKLSGEADIESVVLEAVSNGSVEAKIDEANEQVVILRVSPRLFTVDTWKSLDVKLTEWKKSLQTVIHWQGVVRQ
eukprot:TRINITY_DN7369_c0_g1_i1.p1 TRINITY_DN7369_c0_g1~~TRINITY_DN7369_c0_g1_i1.p1  ORF type:complete len:469 (-),score=109.62 TRINITY_DN7369_c0_g1_i1:112-1476(-)